MRATVAGDSPPSTRATARRRRRSSSAAVPIGRVMFHYTDVQSGIQALAVLISVIGVRHCFSGGRLFSVGGGSAALGGRRMGGGGFRRRASPRPASVQGRFAAGLGW